MVAGVAMTRSQQLDGKVETYTTFSAGGMLLLNPEKPRTMMIVRAYKTKS